jgi:hypothetical protein
MCAITGATLQELEAAIRAAAVGFGMRIVRQRGIASFVSDQPSLKKLRSASAIKKRSRPLTID